MKTACAACQLLLTTAFLAASGTCAAQSSFLDRPMGEDDARLMLNRFGFGPTTSTIKQFSALTPRDYIRQGIREGDALPSAVRSRIESLAAAQPLERTWVAYGPGGSAREGAAENPERRKDIQRTERDYARGAIQARLLAMANSGNPAHEALLAFWLNHFSIYAPKNFVKLLAFDYARTIEDAMRADSFEALLRASFYHPAMQFYLDNVQSTAGDSLMAAMAERRGKTLGINENLARELMELHTLGVDGGYSQKDVQELARIITGAGAWVPRMNPRALARANAIRNGLFLFDPRRHDYGAKTLLGQTFPAGHGLDEIDRALHLLAVNPATARHISRKLALRFMSDTPAEATIESMTSAYLRSGGKISSTLYAMMQSTEFRDSLDHQAKFKEPLDQLLSDARAVCQDQAIGNGPLLVATAIDAGEAPFMKTTPDGYALREPDWMSPAAMAKRIRFAMGIAASRIPLRQMRETDRDVDEDAMPAGRPRFMQGMACDVSPESVERTLGPLSERTSAALDGLGPVERVAALLAAPESMRR